MSQMLFNSYIMFHIIKETGIFSLIFRVRTVFRVTHNYIRYIVKVSYLILLTDTSSSGPLFRHQPPLPPSY